MAQPQRRETNIFELIAENERLEAANAQQAKRIEELENQLRLSAPDADEECYYAPRGTAQSKLGRAMKDGLRVYYTYARQEKNGRIVMSDSELGTAIGIDRRSATDVREGLAGAGFIECVSRCPTTAKWTIDVAKAAEAFQRICLRVVSPDAQQRLWSDGLSGDPDQRVGTSESPTESRMAPADRERQIPPPEDQVSAGVSAQKPPPTSSLVAEYHRRRGGSCAETPALYTAETEQRGGSCAETPALYTAETEQRGGSCAETPAMPYQSGGCDSAPDNALPPSRVRACGTSKTASNPSGSRRAHFSESSSSGSAQDPALECSAQNLPGALGAAVQVISEELLDASAQETRAAGIRKLRDRLIKLGGATPDGERLRPQGAMKIAQAVMAGWLDWHDDVERLLDEGAAKVLRGECPAIFVYLLGTVDQILSDRERPTLFTKRSRRPR